MVLLLRTLARLIAAALLVALALLGLATAIFSIQSDSRTLSLTTLARHFRLPELRGVVGPWLAHLASPGPTAWASLGGGLAAIAVGLLLLVGLVLPPRERLLLVEDREEGRLLARRRALGQMASALGSRVRGVTAMRARVRPRRRGPGGQLRLRATHVPSASSVEVESQLDLALAPFAESFQLKRRVGTQAGRTRVQ